jgi:hypothetical protein
VERRRLAWLTIVHREGTNDLSLPGIDSF